jgi:L,D-peptidoglycan transpeptidase YkuD (ErfK/YbiS/YcfS/YnhG family)
MTFLPLARTLLTAVAPLLPAHDSTTVRPATPAVPVHATPAVATHRDTVADVAPPTPLPAPASASALDSTLSLLFGTPASAVATTNNLTVASAVTAPAAAPAAAVPTAVTTASTASAAPVVYNDGRVPMPAWAIGAHTGLVHAGRADSIVVEKSEHRMTLFSGGQPLGTYLVAIGKQSVGAKSQAGDNKTPEGLYYIDARNPNSRFHLALHVSYPNADDVARARSLGVQTGGDIMIHGLPPRFHSVGAAHRTWDWTNGCVAVTDEEIEQIWTAVPVGTPIRIKP